MTQTSNEPRRILLSVTGGTPQIITETLCALACAAKPFVPTEVHVITTQQGAGSLVDKLFTQGSLARFCEAYAGPLHGQTYQLSETEDLQATGRENFFIHLIRDSAGQPLPDIRTSEDNEQAGDEILKVVRGLCGDKSAKLHVSIAGGRKTMGFYVGYALSLFGSGQHRLSHVLASQEFEQSRAFYPTPEELRANPKIIELAEIPVVFMGSNLPTYFNRYEHFSDLVSRVQSSFTLPYHLSFDLISTTLCFNGVRLSFSPQEFSAYLAVLRCYLSGGGRPVVVDLDYVRQYILVRCFVEQCKRDRVLYTFREGDLTLELLDEKARDGRAVRVVGLSRVEEHKCIVRQFFSCFYPRLQTADDYTAQTVLDEDELLFTLTKSTREKISAIRKALQPVLCAREVEVFKPVYGQKPFSVNLSLDQVEIDFDSARGLLSAPESNSQEPC